MQEAYGWTVAEIDATEIDVILTQAVAMAKQNQPKKTYIEDVLPI